MKWLSEVEPGILVIQIQILSVWLEVQLSQGLELLPPPPHIFWPSDVSEHSSENMMLYVQDSSNWLQICFWCFRLHTYPKNCGYSCFVKVGFFIASTINILFMYSRIENQAKYVGSYYAKFMLRLSVFITHCPVLCSYFDLSTSFGHTT